MLTFLKLMRTSNVVQVTRVDVLLVVKILALVLQLINTDKFNVAAVDTVIDIVVSQQAGATRNDPDYRT